MPYGQTSPQVTAPGHILAPDRVYVLMAAHTQIEASMAPGVQAPLPGGFPLALPWAASFGVCRPPEQRGGEAKETRRRGRARCSRWAISWSSVMRSLQCSSP
jgi:hypothetical protein